MTMWFQSVWIVNILIINVFVVLTESNRIKRVISGIDIDCGLQVRVASLRDAQRSRHLCGAVLIRREVAVTAAHCVQEPYQYILMLNNVCTDEPLPKATVIEIIKHPLYDEYTRAHDIALLRIVLDAYNVTWAHDAILPNSSFGLSGECVVYGYGYTNSESDIYSSRLKAARMRIISLDECTSILGEFVAPRFDSGMICAVGNDADTCQGDSGGPIMCEKKLQGITSYGLSCGVREIPGVYTSIGLHLPWIFKTINYEKLTHNSPT